MSNEEQRQIRIDMQIPLHISGFISTALKDECTRLHQLAAKMSQEEGKPLREQAHEFNAWSDKFRFSHPRPQPQIEHRWEGAHTDQRHGIGNNSLNISDRAGLYVGVLALAAAVLTLGLVLRQPSEMDAKVQAGMAMASKDMQGEVARANATATTANQHARIALDKVEDFRTKLAEKGINVQLDGH